jgi:predicted ArsR family transcriptional regulator
MSTVESKPWTFVTSHTQVLLCIAQNPEARLREVAERVGITERAAQRIVAELVENNYVDRSREGRRNYYAVRQDLPLALPTPRDTDVGSLLNALAPNGSNDQRSKQVRSCAK